MEIDMPTLIILGVGLVTLLILLTIVRAGRK